MSIKAVIDTNVLVSSFISKNPHSPTVRIAKAIADGSFVPVFSDGMICEYEEVLGRGHFNFAMAEVALLIRRIRECGESVLPSDSDEEFPDPDDKVFFCTALASNARLVTGNIKHYPKSAVVVTPAEFCDILGI